MMKLCILLSFLVASPLYVSGHGMVMDPVNRASRWRVDPSAPINWDDNQLYCGSFGQQWNINGGKCGMCGDDYSNPTPRAHELGGKYGQGVIVKSYKAGSTIPVTVFVETNHKGYFLFSLCNLDKYNTETDECYDDNSLTLANGETKYQVDSKTGDHVADVKLPAGVACSHCVLQWTYVTANSWGDCPDGTSGMGCGPQEWFRTCSDISITA